MKKIITFYPALDQRHPNPTKNFGVSPAKIIFALKGKKGVIEFTIHAGWYLPGIAPPAIARTPWGEGIRYHSPKPTFEGEKAYKGGCEYLGNECYCSLILPSSNDDELLKKLIAEGSDAVWKELESYYNSIFEDKEVKNEDNQES